MTQNKRWAQYFAAFVISIGAWGFGCVIGWPSNITEDLRNGKLNGLKMKNNELSWTGSLPTLGATISCLVIGFIADAIGRKTACFITLIPSILGWILIMGARNYYMIYVGRFLTGLGGGGFVVIAPVYATEIAETNVRGTCGLILQVLLSFGVLHANIFGWLLPMVYYTTCCFSIPVMFGILMIFQPESPFYYMSQGKQVEAEKSLKQLRAKDHDIDKEIAIINHLIQLRPERNFKTFITALRTKAQIKATIICFMLMFYQQYCGNKVIVFYTREIFKESNVDLADYQGVIITGCLGFLGTLVSASLVDYTGRKVLLAISTSFCAVGTFFIALFFSFKNNWTANDLYNVEFLPTLGMMLFLFTFNLGIGPIPWLACSELWSPSIKAKLGSIACAFCWFQGFIVSKFYFDVADAIGIDGVFYTFTLISISSVFFIVLVIPETRHKNYDEILVGLDKFCIYC